MNDLEYIKAHSSRESRYEMLAEEATELAHVAQKYARMMRGEQPVSDNLEAVEIFVETFENLREEIADVLLCIGATVCDFYDEDAHDDYLNMCAKNDIGKIYEQKKARWANRLKEKEGK